MADDDVSLDDVFKETLQNSRATNRTDAIVLALHACLIADGFYLIAIGDEGFDANASSGNSVSLSDSRSPGLPSGWNSSHDVYGFQYKQTLSGERVCLVKALPIGDQLVINVLCSNNPSNIVNLSLSLNQYTSPLNGGDTVTMATYRNSLKLFTTISNEINAKIKQGSSSSKTTSRQGNSSKATPTEPTPDPLRVGDVRRPHPFARNDPFAYGGGDLSPFGGPGGMFMDPLRHGGIRGPSLGPRPPGFHPPGARYDPVSPFGPTVPPNRRGGGPGGRGGGMFGPDPDHLPPPGGDDWFS